MRGCARVGRTIARSFALTAVLACTEADQGPRQELLDPASCEECHAEHYRQWLGSMHAYASDDPVFIAMNARGQRETAGELGDFCVRCHAPVAVALGMTVDGTNLDELPQHVKGVTCYFCHNVDAVEGTHNNPIRLAFDEVMRGEYADAVDNDFHSSAYAASVDGEAIASGEMCGSCHDIVNGHGVELERTYKEWVDSFYDEPDPENPELKIYYGNTCNGCHMPGTNSPIADYAGVQTRRFRDHRFVGVDVALTDFPDAELGPALVAEQIEQMNAFREPAVCVGLCVRPPEEGEGTDVVVWLHNEAAGHKWPSGAAQDRRAWVQLEGFAGGVSVLQSGLVGPQESIDAAAIEDPSLWVLRDYAYGADGEHESMFWNVTEIRSELLAVASEAGAKYDKTTWGRRQWHVDGPLDRATIQLNLRPIPFELVDELVEDGLDPAVKTRIPTHTVGATVLEWTADTAVQTDLEGPCVMSAGCFCIISMENELCPPTP
jgi:hypothetical protein